MRREIKFRAWDKNKAVFYFFDLENDNYPEAFWSLHSSKELTEFTGLKDKNGKEIYEGDIVIEPSWWWGALEVIECLSFNGQQRQWIGINGGSKVHNYWHLNELEKIGNIYENPELLQKGTQ